MKNKLFNTVDKIIPAIMAMFSYLMIYENFFYKDRSFLTSFLFIVMIVIFYKNDFKNKTLKKEILISSVLLSFCYTYGQILRTYLFANDINTFLEFLKVENIFNFIGIFNIYYISLNYIMPKLYKYKLKFKEHKTLIPVLVFVISFVVILTCWIPYSFAYYPGLITNDSIDVIKYIKGGLHGLTNHHPVFYILFAYIPVTIGIKCFHSLAAGVALYSIYQMFIMDAIFSYTVLFLYKRKVPMFILVLTILFYAILPVHAIYSLVMWKDIIFGGLLLLFTLEVVKLVELSKEKEIKFKNLISFIIIALLCALFRNNAIYMFIIFAVSVYIILKKHRKILLKTFGIVIISYFLIVGPGYKLAHIKQTESTEYVAIPLQQISRMVYKDVKLTKKEKKLINDLVPIEVIKTRYYPITIDSIKWSKEYNNKVLEKNKFKYFKLWIAMCLKHPIIALEGQGAATLGYWYPNISYWYAPTPTEGVNANHKYKLDITPKTSENIYNVIQSNSNSEKPIMNIEWNFVTWLYIVFIFNIISFKKKKIDGVIPYIPLFGIWFTLLIATPVYAEFRYIYGLFTTFPILLIYPYLKK